MTLTEKKRKRDQLALDAKAIYGRTRDERRDPTQAELAEFDRLTAEVERLDAEIDAGERRQMREQMDDAPEHRAPRPIPGGGFEQERGSGPITGGIEQRKAAAMFGGGGSDGWTSPNEFLMALKSGVGDQRAARAMSEGLVSDGGALVPTQYGNAWLDASLEREIVRRYATVYPMTTLERKIPGLSVDHNTTGYFGGITTQWLEEGGTLTDSQPDMRLITLRAKKLGILAKLSNELLADMTAQAQLEAAFASSMAYALDHAFIAGTGAGQPLGILNSSAVYEQAAEVGQAADTVAFQNIANMWSRLHPDAAANGNVAWLCHPTVLPQLFQMSVVVGVGGVPVFMPANQAAGSPNTMLMGKPLHVTSHCSALGDAGDIILADLSRYAIGLRQELRLDRSPHVYFTSDQEAWRLLARVDGQPMDSETVTLPDGTEVSYFVTLAAR